MAIYRIPLAYVVSTTVQAVCFILALILINSRTTDTVRKHGLTGLLLLIGCSVLSAFNGDVGPWLNAITGSSIDFFSLGSVVVTALGGAGIILLVRSAVASRQVALSRKELR